MSYIESPDGGTRHAYFGGALPAGWRVVDGAIPGPPPPGPDPRDVRLADLEAKLAALTADVNTLKKRGT